MTNRFNVVNKLRPVDQPEVGPRTRGPGPAAGAAHPCMSSAGPMRRPATRRPGRFEEGKRKRCSIVSKHAYERRDSSMKLKHRCFGLVALILLHTTLAGSSAQQRQGPAVALGLRGETPFSGAREIVVPELGTQIALQRLDGFYFVDVTMNERPFRFTLETGANHFAISQRAADRLNLTPTIPAEGGMPRVKVTSLRIGTVEFRGLTAAVSAGFQQMEPDFDGLISIPLLRNLQVTLDFPARTMRLRREGTLPEPNDQDVLRVLRPEPGNRVDVDVSIAGRTFPAVLDTRSPIWFVVPQTEASQLPFTGPLQNAGGARGPTLGNFALSRGALDGDIKLGRYTVAKPTVYLRDRPGVVFGMPLLERFVITLELERGRVGLVHPSGDLIRVDPAQTTVSAPDGPTMGFALGLTPGRGPTIVAVFPGSDAEKKGLRAGDRLIEFDGRPAAEMSREVLRSAASGGKAARVVISRDGKRLEFLVLPFDPRRPL